MSLSLVGRWQTVVSEHPNVEPRPAVANLSTVAVLAVDDEIPLDNFTLELQHALGAIGGCVGHRTTSCWGYSTPSVL